MSILSQLGVTQAQALASSTLGRYDFFVDSSDGKLKAYDINNTLEQVAGASTAAEIEYTLTIPSDWDGTPANVQDALDELASRVKGIEGKTDLITVTGAIDLDDVKAKADSALQSGDNVSELANDAGYISNIVGENHSDLNLDDGTNPHGTTKSDVGLSNVDNTSDADKPISTATQNALDNKKDDFTENSAFNKDFGNSAGDVLEGDTRTITPSEITNIGNQSGVNTGDETTATIQSKRPIKTVNGQSLEGSGNISITSSGVQSVTGDGVDNTDPDNPVLSFPNASQVANAFDKSTDDASDITMASSSQTVQNKIVTMQNEIDSNTTNKRNLTAQKNSIESDGGDLQLVNDEATPTANKNYGTDENGNKGFKNDVRYSKVVSFEDSNLNNFSSNVFTDIPDMQLAIDRDGDYTFVATVNCNNDQNEEIDLTIGLTPITNRVINLPDGTTVSVNAGSQFVSDFQQVRDRQQKNQDQTLSGTFLLDALEDGDLVDFLLNTRNDNVDLENRRAYGYTINNND